VLKGDLVGQGDDAASRQGNVLGIASVAVFAQHLALDAELLVTGAAVIALAAGDHVVEAHSVADFYVGHLWTHLFHHPGDLVSQRLGQGANR
jgi:hypothetical protein